MRRSIDDGLVPAPPDGSDLPATAWVVSICDDYEDAVPRVQLVVEEAGAARAGIVANLDPTGARRLRLALASALRELGEDQGR